jgi:DNA-binding response OmpR family regulator
MRILIVDDDPLVRRALARVLGREPKLDVEHVGTADEALASFHARHVDLAILDLQMPEVTGVELARRLRALRGDLRVLFVTAEPTCGVADEARTMPSEGVLPKPWKTDELLAIVRNLSA